MIPMKGRLKCTKCGHEFDVSKATFTFELSKPSPGSITCPKCGCDDVEPVMER